MKNKTTIAWIAGLAGAYVLSIAPSLNAQSFAPQIFGNSVKPRINLILDNSGSMDTTSAAFNTVCTCYNNIPAAGPLYPPPLGKKKYDCDENGTAQTREDMLNGILRAFLDTNGSATCVGDRLTSVDSGDDWGLEFGFFHFRGATDAAPIIDSEDLSNTGYPGWPPTINPQNYCETGTTKLRYRVQRTTQLDSLNQYINIMTPNGTTPLASSLLYMQTDSQALPWLATNDPDFACRIEATVTITDGDDTCAGNTVAVRKANIVTAATNLYNYTPPSATPHPVLGYFVGFTSGLSLDGQEMLNTAAKAMHTDANGDGDNDMNTYCLTAGHNNLGGANPACNGCTGGSPVCPGNAYLVANPGQLITALQAIANNLLTGTYSVSPPNLAFSGDGTPGVLYSYFGVRDVNPAVPVWTGHFRHATPDTSGVYNTFKYQAEQAIPLQVAAGRTRKHITLGTLAGDTGKLIDFVEGDVPAKIPLTEFFPTVTTFDDFNGVGAVGDADDAKDIIRWIRGEPTSIATGNPNLTWKGPGIPYTLADWPFGSVFHSLPVLFGAPNDALKLNRVVNGNSYIQYIINNSDRDRVALLPTNSGTLSIINDTAHDDPTPYTTYAEGEEILAYVPVANRSRFREMRDHTVLLNDGYTARADIYAPVADQWQTRAYVGLGGGGNAIVGLNMTGTRHLADCITAGTCTANDNWEFTNGDLGLTTGKSAIIEVRDSTNAIVPLLVVPGGSMNPAKSATNPDNSRFLFFINAETGVLVRKMEVVPLTATTSVGKQIDPYAGWTVPSGMNTRPAAVDLDGNDQADYIFVGTGQGDVYRINVNDPSGTITNAYDFLVASSNVGIPIWQARDRNSSDNLFGGDQSGSVTCTLPSPPGACEAKTAKRDRQVDTILPYFETGSASSLKLVVFFGNPLGSDDDGKPVATTYPRGTIIRVIDNPLAYNAERHLTDSAAEVYGPTLLPREMYYDGVNNKIDRNIDAGSAFVINNTLYYLLFRPSVASCAGNGDTFLAAINLLTGKDVVVTTTPGAPPPPASNNSGASTSNYFDVTGAGNQGAATMLVNYTTGEINFGFTVGAPPTNVQVQKVTFPFNWPQSGLIGWTQMF